MSCQYMLGLRKCSLVFEQEKISKPYIIKSQSSKSSCFIFLGLYEKEIGNFCEMCTLGAEGC